VVLAANIRYIHVRRRQLKPISIDGIDDLRYRKVAEQFVIQRVLGQCQGVFLGLDVLPKPAFGEVAFADLPLPRWILEPPLEARFARRLQHRPFETHDCSRANLGLW
jgi:hypothetical protein